MENTIVKDIILGKKIDGYSVNTDNFKAQGELTVEITLNEYRKLVEESATASSRIDEANKNKYDREQENKRLKEQIEALKAENYELKKALDDEIIHRGEVGKKDE